MAYGDPQFWTEEKKRELKPLVDAGLLSANEMKAAVGAVSRNAVIGIIHREGWDWVRKGQTSPGRKPKPRDAVVRKSVVVTRTHARALEHIDPIFVHPTVDQDIPLEQRRSILTLTNDVCKWPVGDPFDPEFFYCGAVAESERPYCAAHTKRSIDTPAMRRADERMRARRAQSLAVWG